MVSETWRTSTEFSRSSVSAPIQGREKQLIPPDRNGISSSSPYHATCTHSFTNTDAGLEQRHTTNTKTPKSAYHSFSKGQSGPIAHHSLTQPPSQRSDEATSSLMSQPENYSSGPLTLVYRNLSHLCVWTCF
ncbi:hypothetical protein HPB50_007217 [Hyalomma asiaticum]|uniref:Uncharacterized protein n=1 Tax=Hyalomma asiaticum TaxID=266040 RepID=A0ACB7S5A6_HYAAI|nr:hypothetical protein HPB50_007217 [Hyalomma asiaticum]